MRVLFRFVEEGEEFVFGQHGDAELGAFVALGGAHVLAGEDEAGLFGD